MRDLFDTNPYFAKYRELIWANVFGEKGIMLRMKVKETEDRVVHSPDERAYIRAYEERRLRVAEWAASKTGQDFIREQHSLCLLREHGVNGSRVAQVKVGQPDVYANKIIEDAKNFYHGEVNLQKAAEAAILAKSAPVYRDLYVSARDENESLSKRISE